MTTTQRPMSRTPNRASSGSTTTATETQSSMSTSPQEPQQQQQPSASMPSMSEPMGDMEARFLNVLIPAVTTAVGHLAPSLAPKFGGAIGGLLGGASGAKTGMTVGSQIGEVFGGMFGARGTEQAIGTSTLLAEVNSEIEQFQLMQATTQLTQACTPAIIDAIRQELQIGGARDAIASTGQIDDETMERGWGFLASVVADQVIKHAPKVIKKVTKELGSVIGSRDVDEYDPLLVDTETTQRFVLPAMSTILAGVQTCLPQLYSLVGGAREMPRETTISWPDLERPQRLWDNDNIAVLSVTQIDNPDEIEFVLELAPHKSWWKGIQIQDENGSFVAEISVGDRTKTATTRVPAQRILMPGGSLLFMKSKMFGIHTGMYRLPLTGLDRFKGQRIHFFWYAD